MSLNLHCNKIDLRQTPTFVTEMCMVQSDGDMPWELSGKKAQHALWIYIQWLHGTLNGAYESTQAANERCAMVDAEIQEIKKVMKDKKLKVTQQ